jgi:hypothetical protein
MMRKFKTMLLFGGLALLATQLISCADTVKASLDATNDHEGGQSAYKHNAGYGLNLGLNWITGLSVGTGKLSRAPDQGPYYASEDPTNATGYPAWNAFDPTVPATTNGSFKLGTEIEFVQKGSKTTGFNSRENYLEGQADLLYYSRISNGDGLYGGLGPYIAYGIGGKSGSGQFEASTFGGTDGYKRFDAGLNLKAGYEMSSGLAFELGYDFGLVDKSPDPSDFTSRNRAFSISVGYSFDKIVSVFKKK